MKKRMILGVGAAALMIAAGADAAQYQWDWQVGDPGPYYVDNGGGKFKSVHTSFDTDSNHFTYEVSFSNKVTKGFTLAITDGAAPGNTPGEIALLYVDATNKNNLKLTAYGYNGSLYDTSWKDGNAAAPGTQTPDLILDHNDPNWIISRSVVDAGGTRTISFTIDATAINAHNPDYPDPQGDPWAGISFGETMGVRMHTFQQFNAGYHSNGKIKSFNPVCDGWFKASYMETVPAPGSAALLGIGLIGSARRRSRR